MSTFLLPLARYLSRLALAFSVGEMLFFIVIFAPRVFRVLPRTQAGELQGAIFPPYYLAGIIASCVLLGTTLGRYVLRDATLPDTTGKKILIFSLIAVTIAIFYYSYSILTPDLNQLRTQMLALNDESAQQPLRERFQLLHKLSVQVNSGALLALLILLAFL